MIKGKKGFEMTLGTIVILILAVVLLLFLILFFTGSADPLLGKIKSYFSHSNVDNVIDGCNVLADTNAQYAFCCEKKTVKYSKDGDKEEGKFSCFELVDKSFINNKIKKLDCEEVNC